MTQTVYCGVDFHARSQTIAYCNSGHGEVQITQLDHREDDLRQFYSQLQGKVIVGLETCGTSRWFEHLLEGLGCEVWIGHASEVRRFARRRQTTMIKNSLQAMAKGAGDRCREGDGLSPECS